MTFDPHPVKVLNPARRLPKIFDVADQEKQLRELGVDLLVVEPFSREFSQVPADRYIKDWIQAPFHPKTVVVGYDFSFGANRQGTIEFLQNAAPSYGFNVEVIPQVEVNGVLVSSSRIRQAVESGDVKLASELLGRTFYLEGTVEKGAGRGRTIGIPTANLRVAAELLPGRGVYAARARVRDQSLNCVVNIGLNPTFTESTLQSLSIEAHLLDYSGDLYGERLRLDFVQRLRDEKKFGSVDELVRQIHADILEGRRILA